MKAKTESKISFEAQIEQIIDKDIRPQLLEHGGNLYIKKITGKDVGLVFTGSCKTCPAAQITLEEIIDKKLREVMGDGLGRVYLINETSEELLDFARKLMKNH